MGVAQGISQFSVPQGFVPTQVWCTQGQQPGELMDGGSKGRADLSWSPRGAQLEHPCVAELWQDVLPLPEVDVFTSWALFYVGDNSACVTPLSAVNVHPILWHCQC